MALPNEHQLNFNQYKDAKTLFAAIQTRFGGNGATKKTQKTLLKQMYENFNAPSTESLDSIFNRLQKIVSQLAILVSTDSTLDSTANLSDAIFYAFLANQDDLEKMHLKWQLALLSMRARRYYQRIGKKLTNNGSDTAGYDKSKVECFNCHKMRHFARECRASKVMVAIDGASFDWSYMADEEVPTNMALMAFSDSEFNLATYKRGLASVEEQLVFYKKNKVLFYDQITILERDASFKDSEINALNIQTE
ncbi:ribonuclease H-like domain-containing protein [Tanacetum coccineum]